MTATTTAGTRQAAQDEPNPTDRYLARVREQLDGLPPHKRLAFVCAERTKFLIEYARFENRMGKNKAPRPGESAAEYIITIAALGKLKGAIERRNAVIPPVEAL